MNPTGLIPEAGMGAMSRGEWLHAVRKLGLWIPDLQETLSALRGQDVLERELVIGLMVETLVDLICMPSAKLWLSEIEAAGFGAGLGRAS